MFLLSIVFSLFGGNVQANVCQFGTEIFYGNGMFNTLEDAKDSLKELESLNLTKVEKSNEALEYDLAFNRNETAAQNLLSVVLQKLDNDYRAAWRLLLGIETPSGFKDIDLTALQLEPVRTNLETMIRQYRDAIQQGKRIILVSHSQGNFYAEEALDALAQGFNPLAAGIGNVRVASPAFSSYGFPYTTFEDDFIINSVRKIAGAPKANLPSIGAGPSPRDRLGHNFLRT